MGGWGRQFLNITPAGKVLPCHAAESLNFLKFDNLKEKSLAWIWEHSESFNRFRGTDWMPEPCQSCDRREIDWGGHPNQFLFYHRIDKVQASNQFL